MDNDSAELEFGIVDWADGIGIFGLSFPECLDGPAVEETQEGTAKEPDDRGYSERDDRHTDLEQTEESPVQCKDRKLGEPERIRVCELEDVQIKRAVADDYSWRAGDLS